MEEIFDMEEPMDLEDRLEGLLSSDTPMNKRCGNCKHIRVADISLDGDVIPDVIYCAHKDKGWQEVDFYETCPEWKPKEKEKEE